KIRVAWPFAAATAAAAAHAPLHQLGGLVLDGRDERLPRRRRLECVAQAHALLDHLVDARLGLGCQAARRHDRRPIVAAIGSLGLGGGCRRRRLLARSCRRRRRRLLAGRRRLLGRLARAELFVFLVLFVLVALVLVLILVVLGAETELVLVLFVEVLGLGLE